jgi:hypothetical protein
VSSGQPGNREGDEQGWQVHADSGFGQGDTKVTPHPYACIARQQYEGPKGYPVTTAGGHQRERVAVQAVQQFETAPGQGKARLGALLEFAQVEACGKHILAAVQYYRPGVFFGPIQAGADIVDQAMADRIGFAVVHMQNSHVIE